MLFFERDIELYVSTVDTGYTTDNTVKIAVLSGSTINYKSTSQETYNYKIEASPNRVAENILTGYSNPEFNFTTYAKPYNDTTNDTTVEKLLLYSLTGNLGTEDTGNYTTEFVSSNKLPELYLFVKFGDLIYRMSNMVVKSAEYKFELNKILTISWKLIGLTLTKVNSNLLPTLYTDYTTVTSSYIKSNFTTINLNYTKALTGTQSIIFLDGTDFLNKGTGGAVVGNSGTTLHTQADIPGYDTGVGNNLWFAGATFTGLAYPDSGTTTMVLEALVWWGHDPTSTEQYVFHTTGTKVSFRYGQMQFDTPDNVRLYQGGGAVSFDCANSMITGEWNHVVLLFDPANKMYHGLINGEPVVNKWLHTDRNKTTAATTGWSVGSGFWDGYIAYPELNWNVPNKYTVNYDSSPNLSTDANTVVYIGSTFDDQSSYNHTVTGNNASEETGYIRAPWPTWASPGSVSVARSAAFNSTDWTIELRFAYQRTGGAFVGGTIYDDGIRRLTLSNNQLFLYINGVAVCQDQNISTGWYTLSFPKGTWLEICAEEYQGAYYLYVNGILRGGNAARTVVSGTVPSTGNATLISHAGAGGSGDYFYLAQFKLSDISRYAATNYKNNVSSYITDFQGKLPIIQGTVKLKNNVQMVDRNTLDQREIQRLDHYVKERTTEIDFTGYLRTGTLSNDELFDTINSDIDYNDDGNTIETTLSIGKDGNNVKFELPNSQVQLPEIKIKDILTSNIKITSKKLDVDNDDTKITYTTQEP